MCPALSMVGFCQLALGLIIQSEPFRSVVAWLRDGALNIESETNSAQENENLQQPFFFEPGYGAIR